MKLYAWPLLLLLVVGCKSKYHIVYPVIETEPVRNADDAADDIAIYIHPDDPDKQVIIGTNKQAGLVLYDNQGKIINEYPIGRINNVDLRQQVDWNEEAITIVGGSNRSNNSIVFYRLDEEEMTLEALHDQPVFSRVNEVYGFCMYQSEECYAFVVGKDGVVEQWLLRPKGNGMLRAEMVRSFDVGGQCEGLVADDGLKVLYVGEEAEGVWKYGAEPDQGETRTKVELIRENTRLKADIEGLTIYYKELNNGYLIVSSQGNNSYAVYDRQGDNRYLGSFKIKANDRFGGTSETDGIDVTSKPFGAYPRGVFIAQDGNNGRANQNFKVVDCQEIERGISQ
ncbi:MAG: phytase [Bacteroidota bacterium]